MNARSTDISKKRQPAGRLGGRKRSERKATAVRANAAKGGQVQTPQSKTVHTQSMTVKLRRAVLRVIQPLRYRLTFHRSIADETHFLCIADLSSK